MGYLPLRLPHSTTETGERRRLPRDTDLLQVPEPVYVHIHDAQFKYFCGDRLIRFYGDGDLVLARGAADCRLLCEFGAEVTWYPEAVVQQHMQHDAHAVPLWQRWFAADLELMHRLCACYIPDDVSPDIQTRVYQPHELIIAEGDEPIEIYELISGTAVVRKEGMDMSKIQAGEIFGEVSFLTGSKRTAEVVATTKCMVQVMRHEDFARLAKIKPRMILAVAKLLAERLVHSSSELAQERSATLAGRAD